MGKNNKRKTGPDEGLVIEQLYSLNKEFYSDYSKDYFGLKMLVLGRVISNPGRFLDLMNNDEPVKIGAFEVKGNNKIEIDEIEKYAKLELATTYYHCIETFLRLFMAHSTLKQCPWFEISRETSFVEFKKKLAEFSERRFNIRHEQLSEDDVFLYVFYGTTELSELKEFDEKLSKEEAAGVLKKWIEWASRELLKVYDYNAYKHGLNIATGKRGFKLGQGEDDKIEEHGESLKFITKIEKKDRWVWQKNIVFTPLDFRAAMIHIINGLINNIIKVGRFTYLKEQFSEFLFLGSKALPESFYKEIKTENKFGVSVEGYSIELQYYKKDTNAI
ncbi:hypothetical protein DFR58_12440 [Anaerobacterium chartisolvens]|uniref:Uncharacterized protein n=1 Tax=Anaerobacterium chartisolvens TaxID=1297424 RepID=A0A369ARV7_9FIRM|nr:hypothetical protein [Anaerobacterium chartisolvens]RCX12090.1 hypothetical protein DFR58_12440 [Anaerobacterium chartisolvens]